MSRDIPEFADLRHLAKNHRGFKGSWPISRMARVLAILDEQKSCVSDFIEQGHGQGDRLVDFNMEFGQDETDVLFCRIKIETTLKLICQRSLQSFEYGIQRSSMLGLIEDIDEDVSLPAQYEPYLMHEIPFKLATVIEDEVILALPLVAVNDGEPISQGFGLDIPDTSIVETSNPFAALQQLKHNKNSN